MTLTDGLLVKVGESFVEDFCTLLKDAAVKKWQSFNWYTAQGNYYRKIEEDFGTTRILGKTKPVSLEGIYTDVYLLDKVTAWQRFDFLKLQKDPEVLNKRQTRLAGFDLVKNQAAHRFFILGKPGAGKTTFLKFIALKAAKQEIGRIPIFVSLKEWADSGLKLIPFLINQFDICSFPDSKPLIEYILEVGSGLILFDGLDETQQEDGTRERIISEIRDFSRKYHRAQILVTCRIAATEYTFEKFTYLEVADFTDEQIDLYVQKWFVDDPKTRQSFNQEFRRKENRGLRELANTPLLLSLLCLNFEETGTFPNRRVEIYEEGLRALLVKWDASRNIKRDEIYKGLSPGRKKQMFSHIAVQTFPHGIQFVSKRRLEKLIVSFLELLPDVTPYDYVDGECILRAIEAQHSIFVERANNIYSFSHLSFQEYFVAKYLVDNSTKGTLAYLLKPENIANARWYEVIQNVAGLLDNSSTFYKLFIKSVGDLMNRNKNLVNFFDSIYKKTADIAKNTNVLFRCLYTAMEICLIEKTKLRQMEDNFFLQEQITKVLIIIKSLNLKTTQYSSEYFVEAASSLNKAEYITFPIIDTKKRVFVLLGESNVDLDLKLTKFYVFAEWLSGKEKIGTSQIELTYLTRIWNKIRKDYRGPGQHTLSNLLIPTSFEPWNWKTFADNLRNFLKVFRQIGNTEKFTDEELLLLGDYLDSNIILLKCLRLTLLSDRQEIENKLLLSLPNLSETQTSDT